MALDRLPARLDTRLVFPAVKGGQLKHRLAPLPGVVARGRGGWHHDPGDDLRPAQDVRVERARCRHHGVRTRPSDGQQRWDDRASLRDAARRCQSRDRRPPDALRAGGRGREEGQGGRWLVSNPHGSPILLTTAEVARWLRVNPQTILRWHAEGHLPGGVAPEDRTRARPSLRSGRRGSVVGAPPKLSLVSYGPLSGHSRLALKASKRLFPLCLPQWSVPGSNRRPSACKIAKQGNNTSVSVSLSQLASVIRDTESWNRGPFRGPYVSRRD